MLSSFSKVCAVLAAAIGVIVIMSATDVRADQTTAPGQQNRLNDPNGNQGTPPGLSPGSNGAEHSRRNENCRGRGCTTTPPDCQSNCPLPVTPVATEDEGESELINCLDPQFKTDPRCIVPTKKTAKRKIVSVKLTSDEITAPVVAPAAEVAITPAPVEAPVVKAKPAATVDKVNDLGTTNFQ